MDLAEDYLSTLLSRRSPRARQFIWEVLHAVVNSAPYEQYTNHMDIQSTSRVASSIWSHA